MLTSDLVRGSVYRGKLRPGFLDAEDPVWQEAAETLLALFRNATGRSVSAIREEIAELIEGEDHPAVWKGLARVLEGRCALALPDRQLGWESRLEFFSRAADLRRSGKLSAENRELLVADAGEKLGLAPAEFIQALYADVPGNESVQSFEDITGTRLIGEYNQALAQGVVLRAESLSVRLDHFSAQHMRVLIRAAKFHQLHWELVEKSEGGRNHLLIRLDGPMSLFDATTKYGLRLACFLPNALALEGAAVSAVVHWGKKPVRKVEWEHSGGKVSFPNRHRLDECFQTEIEGFYKLWLEEFPDWDIEPCRKVIPIGDGRFWVPDYRLTKRETGASLFLEIHPNPGKESLSRLTTALDRQKGVPWLLLAKGNPNKFGTNNSGLVWFRSFPAPAKIIDLVGQRALTRLPDECLDG
jgi:predicted nuclease of restriction endonuclease-like RecB superfamily